MLRLVETIVISIYRRTAGGVGSTRLQPGE